MLRLHRQVHATIVYLMDAAQFIGALVLVKPWSHFKTNNPRRLSTTIGLIIVLGSLVFGTLAYLGEKLVQVQEGYERDEQEEAAVKELELGTKADAQQDAKVVETAETSRQQ